jgi:hypothetical protein
LRARAVATFAGSKLGPVDNVKVEAQVSYIDESLAAFWTVELDYGIAERRNPPRPFHYRYDTSKAKGRRGNPEQPPALLILFGMGWELTSNGKSP